MSLARNRKGFELSITTIIEIILIVVATGFLIGIFSSAASKADEKTAENLCRGFNAIRFATKVEKKPISFNIVPRACKTIDKGDLPGKDYKDYEGGDSEGAAAQIRDLTAKCWWMWLEGKQINMLETSTLAIQNKCFICYVFSLQNGVSVGISAGTNNLIKKLDEPYYAIDRSDKCASKGEGGICRPSCDKASDFPKEVSSIKCKQKEKCCVPESNKDECLSKGGQCSSVPKEGYMKFDKWQCKTGSCYVKKENMASYLDYIQGTKGVGDGAGYLAFQKDLDTLASNKKYGVVLVSPGNSPSWDTLGLGAATVAAGAGTVAATYFTPGFKKEIAVGGTAGTIYLYGLTASSGNPNINYLYISDYDSIKEKCAVELGVGES